MRSFSSAVCRLLRSAGGLIGEYALQTKVWRWLGLFVPLAASMWLLQQSSYPASPHVEWPGWVSRNAWTSAFLWIRGHTPKGAVFALDPNYMLLPGGRAPVFAPSPSGACSPNRVKDSGAVSLFPQLASHWKDQVRRKAAGEELSSRGFPEPGRPVPRHLDSHAESSARRSDLPLTRSHGLS